MEPAKPLHVVRLEADNFKKLRAVRIEPKSRMVQITGKNANGKSSVLDSLFGALCGGAALPPDPIRHGEEKARVKVDLGELIVTRTFTASGTTLKIEDAEGKNFKSPQTMLNSLIGSLTFDPLAFTRMSGKAQAEELRKVAEIGLDIDLIDSQIQELRERRARVHSDMRTALATADAIPAKTQEPLIDTEPFITRLGEFTKKWKENQTRTTELENLKKKIEEQKERKNKALSAVAEIDAWLNIASEAFSKLPTPEELERPGDIERALEEANRKNIEINQANALLTRRKEYLESAKALEQKANAFAQDLEAKEAARANALSAAKMPVEGLGFKDGMITYQGIPFEQASAAEQLRISVAIAMAANPRVRILRISDGSLLDEDNFALLSEMCEKGDFQCWIETVESDKNIGIYIEDGEVKSDTVGVDEENQFEMMSEVGNFPPPPPSEEEF
jgi:hypothetical protein